LTRDNQRRNKQRKDARRKKRQKRKPPVREAVSKIFLSIKTGKFLIPIKYRNCDFYSVS